MGEVGGITGSGTRNILWATVVYDEITDMSNNMLKDVAIAIASDSLQQRTNLRKVMEQSGLQVVLSEPLTRLFLRKLEKSAADVLLLDLHDDVEHDDELIDEVLDKVDIPVIFNDVTALTVNEPANNPKWHHTLMRKIAESTGTGEWKAENTSVKIEEKSQEYTQKKASVQGIARNVWVLGASLGGPEAVKRFLRALPDDLPVSFILVQHLGANFVGLLAEQLDRVTALQVIPSRDGHLLMHQQVLVAPVDERLEINPIGNIEFHELEKETAYKPSIDLVVSDMACRFGNRSGAIFFSGMGDDGKLGCRVMKEKGGQVWVQTSESCVVSSMPDTVKSSCEVDFCGNPEQLAKQLVNHLKASGDY